MCSDFVNALRLLDEKRTKIRLSTGYQELDCLIGNGIEMGTFYLFYGQPESGIDIFLHHLMANALGAGDRAYKVVYLNCGNYREDKTILDIPSLIHLLKSNKSDVKECLERVLVYCAFSEEQQEQVVEEVIKMIEETKEVRLLIVHNIAKLFTSEGRQGDRRYKNIPRLQRVLLRLWQTCASRSVAMVASCKPTELRRGIIPKPEGGRYLSHEANLIVYLEKTTGLFPALQAHLLKHPAKPHGEAVLNINGGENGMERITVPFKVRFEKELESLKDFRDALKDLERQAAYDQIVKVCMSECGTMANTNIPTILEAMLLTASIDNRGRIDHLSKRVEVLEGDVRKLKFQIHVDDNVDK